MENSSDREHRQTRAMRAIQLAAVSGFVERHLPLQESCLALCNAGRECVPLQCTRIFLDGPSKLLQVFRPDLRCFEADDTCRILLPERVLKVYWDFNDFAGRHSAKRSLSEMYTEDEIPTTKHGQVVPWNIDMTKVRWPTGISEIYLSIFDQPVEQVVWPDSLKLLAFCWPGHDDKHALCDVFDHFNQPLDGVTFPAGLREIYLGPEFDRRIDGVTWPESLELLSMPGYDHPIGNVRWPPRLKTLNFLLSSDINYRQSPSGESLCWDECEVLGFDGPLDSFLPMSLETLWLSDNFAQSLRGVTWPSGLALLGIGTRMYDDLFDGVEWPPSLRKLVVSDFLEEVVSDLDPGIEVVLVPVVSSQ